MKGKKFYAWLILQKKIPWKPDSKPSLYPFFHKPSFFDRLNGSDIYFRALPLCNPTQSCEIFHCNLGVLVLKGHLSLSRVHSKFELQFRHSNQGFRQDETDLESRNKGTEVPSLSNNKGTTGHVQNLIIGLAEPGL